MVLVERREELDVLAASFADCVTGSGLVAIISGPVGSGKTELLRTFAQRAVEAGAIFLSASASRGEGMLPLGVVGQLFASARLPAEEADRAARLLEDGALTAALAEPGSAASGQVTAPVLSGLTKILLDLASRAPLLVGIDDAHFADLASLQYVLYLVRRIGQARVLVVLNETVRPRHPHPVFRAELVSQLTCRQLRLGLLSGYGVATILRERLNLPETYQLASIGHEISGGNPMLLNALIQDGQTGGECGAALVVGDAFGQAVLSCLYRSDTTLLGLAQVIAALGEPAPPALIGELLGLDAESTDRAIGAAAEMGLLHKGQFRHARARVAVLDAMAVEERAALHERIARVLHANGATAVVVAKHMIAANVSDASWFVPILREAAESALEADDLALALDCCRLAGRARAVGNERAAVKAVRAQTQWRLDPSAAERMISDLVEDARAGHLTARYGVALVSYLCWYGRPEEALDLLDRFSAAADASDFDTAIGLYLARLWLCYVYPGLSSRVRLSCVAPQTDVFGATKWELHIQVGRIIEALVNGDMTVDVPTDAEHFLHNTELHDTTLGLSLAFQEALIGSERLDAAASWCDSLLNQAETRRAPVWQALYSAIRAMINFLQGDLPTAEESARAALTKMSPKGWGVLIGAPLSTLVLATARTGDYDNALAHLSMQVPKAMFETRFGVYYLRARGHYNLARGNQQAAIKDFATCRELMAGWGLDLPGLVPWRIDMAEALLGLGQHAQARELVYEQLTRLGPHNGRTRGISLRVLAAVSEPQHRPAVLREAVAMLQASGDELELDRALTDLRNDQRADGEHLGDHAKLRLTVQPNLHVTTKCRATLTGPAQPPHPAAPSSTPIHAAAGQDDGIANLSDAELRVAALAVRGHTNPQIARTLFVTVSTVEQHLTRVYRKLRVSRRSDLPPTLVSQLSRLA